MTDPNTKLAILNMSVSLCVIVLSIPLINRKVPINKWYGFRTMTARKSEENWYRVNRIGGQMLMLYSVPLFLLGVLTFFLPPLTKTLSLVIANGSLVYLAALIHANLRIAAADHKVSR